MAKFLSIIMLLAGMFAASGCALFAKDPPQAALVVFQKSSHIRPGDAVVAEVVLISSSETSMKLPVLNPENVKFWVEDAGGQNNPAAPVVSPDEDMTRTDTLEPGGSWRRTFVIPSAAETSTGVLTLQAVYSPPREPAGTGISFPLASDPVKMLAGGRREFHRDADGRITAADASLAARKQMMMGPEYSAVAEPSAHGKKLWDWRVAFYERKTGKFAGARLVNPYLGVVRAEGSPGPLPGSQQKAAKPQGRM